MARIKAKAPVSYAPQVNDTEKRLGLLFDHLNNDDLLGPETVATMVNISQCVGQGQWDQAQSLFTEMHAAKEKAEGGNWMVRSLTNYCSHDNAFIDYFLVGRQATD